MPPRAGATNGENDYEPGLPDFDPVKHHNSYCPWVNGTVAAACCSNTGASSSNSALSGWQLTVDALDTFQSLGLSQNQTMQSDSTASLYMDDQVAPNGKLVRCMMADATHLRYRRRRETARMPSLPLPLSSLCRRRRRRFLLVLILLCPLLLSPARSLEEARALSVGEELLAETMPLRHGRRLYRLAGLRPLAWYEVKISYPASIPSSFSIRLVDDPDALEDWGSKNRRLLNTEKIIFKAESNKPVYILVTVEPEGVVAKPNVPERELALFNIVCDELLLGIPHFAWWVGIAALLCIVSASLAPYFLPLYELLDYEAAELSDVDAAKLS